MTYRDWMNIDNPNGLDENLLKRAIKSMANAANKRLKRMEDRGINFGEETGKNTTAGVKRFTVRGKNLQELKNEFKRVRNFLNNPQSSLSGMKRVFKDFKETVKKARRLTRAEKKEYEKMSKQKKTSGMSRDRKLSQWEELKQWRDTWNLYNRLVDEGYYTPTEYDSTQARETIIAVIKYRDVYNLSDEETWRRLLEEMNYNYEKSQIDDDDDDISTSSFFAGGSD